MNGEEQRPAGWPRVFVALFQAKGFWILSALTIVIVTGFANAALIVDGMERIVRAWRCG